jgi:hypothetical protein
MSKSADDDPNTCSIPAARAYRTTADPTIPVQPATNKRFRRTSMLTFDSRKIEN